jgi:hypothetical protein
VPFPANIVAAGALSLSHPGDVLPAGDSRRLDAQPWPNTGLRRHAGTVVAFGDILPMACREPLIDAQEVPIMTDTVNDEITHLAGAIRALERQLEVSLAKRRIELNYRVQDGIVQFEQAVIAKHRLLKSRLLSYVVGARPAMILTAPVIYSLIVPLLLLDLFAALYQAVCFPVYGIPRVRRGDYLAFDRGQLGYLNAIERINCEYCAYANGLIAYVREIASRTEEYWCPIKHARRMLEPGNLIKELSGLRNHAADRPLRGSPISSSASPASP